MKNRGKVTYLKVAILMLLTRIQIRTFGNFFNKIWRLRALQTIQAARNYHNIRKKLLPVHIHTTKKRRPPLVFGTERYLAEKDSFQESIFLHEARKKKNVLSRYPPFPSLEVRKLTPTLEEPRCFLFKAREEGGREEKVFMYW